MLVQSEVGFLKPLHATPTHCVPITTFNKALFGHFCMPASRSLPADEECPLAVEMTRSIVLQDYRQLYRKS